MRGTYRGRTTLIGPSLLEYTDEFVHVPWSGVAYGPTALYAVERLFLTPIRNWRPDDPDLAIKIAELVANIDGQSARYKRFFLAYAFWMVRQHCPFPRFTSLTGATICRTIDELHTELCIPRRVVSHLRSILAEYAYGELRSDAVRHIRRWRLENPKQPFDQWLTDQKEGWR